MRWIVGPRWDICWIWSGIPIALALIMLPPVARYWIFAVGISLETSHALSPIVLAWISRGFRRTIIYRRPVKLIIIPLLVFLVAAAIGVLVNARIIPLPHKGLLLTGPTGDIIQVNFAVLLNPYFDLVLLYLVWNTYHFGMQFFGLVRLYGVRGNRFVQRVLCVGGTGFAMLGLPFFTASQTLAFLSAGILSFNHWLVDLGLSSRAAGKWWLFLPVVIALGQISWMWSYSTPEGMQVYRLIWMLGMRMGIGIVHFLYSAQVWKFSDPQVRATIGRDLLAHA